jgi:hypothetical protein
VCVCVCVCVCMYIYTYNDEPMHELKPTHVQPKAYRNTT